MEKISVYIVDDHSIILDGIQAMFLGNAIIDIQLALSNSGELMKALLKNTPDVLLLDITLPQLSGIEICKLLQEQYPNIAVLMLSSKSDQLTITESIKAGAKGFLSKNIAKEEIEKAIKTVAKGNMYFGEGVSQTIFNSYVKGLRNNSLQEFKSNLTQREIEIIKLFSDGLLYKEIAYELEISIKTVEAHKAKIMKKIEAKSTAELVKYAIREGLTSLD